MPRKKTTRKAATTKPTPRPVATCSHCGRPGHGADDIECPARRVGLAAICHTCGHQRGSHPTAGACCYTLPNRKRCKCRRFDPITYAQAIKAAEMAAARADIAAGNTAPGGKADRAAAVDGACEAACEAAIHALIDQAERTVDVIRASGLSEPSADGLLDSLVETTGILTDLYAGKNVSGRVLDAIDSSNAAMRQHKAEPKPPPVADDGLLDLLRMVARKPRECSDSPYMRDKAVLKFEDYELARIDAAIAKATTQAGGPPAIGAAPSAD